MSHEESLLGAVLSGYPDFPSLTRVVSERDFASAHNGAIWDACLAVHKSGLAVEPETVGVQLGECVKRFPDGRLYLLNLLAAPVTVTNAPWYAERVRQLSLKRRMGDVGRRMVQYADNDDERTAAEMAADVRRWADEVGTVTKTQPTMSEALERVIDIAQHGEVRSTPTPWPSLDEMLGGFSPGQLITFAARPGVGKSIALGNISLDMARRGRWVAMCSLEMTATEVVQRMMANVAAVDLTRLRRASCDEADWKRIGEAQEHLAALPLHIQDFRPQTMDDIRAHAWDVRQQARRKGAELGAVVVDYIQIIRADGGHKNFSRQQQVGQITQGLKNLAGELEVPVITAAQLNRGAVATPNAQPELSHLREAGDIEQDSDAVILMHEPMVEDDRGRMIETGEVEMIAAKARAGVKGMRVLMKRGYLSRLSER